MAFSFNFSKKIKYQRSSAFTFKKLDLNKLTTPSSNLTIKNISKKVYLNTPGFSIKKIKRHVYEEASYFQKSDIYLKFENYYLHFQNAEDLKNFSGSFEDHSDYQTELEKLCEEYCISENSSSGGTTSNINKYVKVFKAPIFKEVEITHNLKSTDILLNIWIKTTDDKTFFNDNTSIEIIDKNTLKVYFTNYSEIKEFKIICMV